MPDAASLHGISSQLERGEISSALYLRLLARYMARQIECSRAGVWFFVDSPAGRLLRCAALFDSVKDKMLNHADIGSAVVGPYFEVLARDGCVMATDAHGHPALAGFLATYLAPNDVAAKLDVGFSVNGVLVGIFSCEQIGAGRNWTQRELQSLRQISSQAGLALMRAATRVVDTAPGAMWDMNNPNWLVTLRDDLPPEDTSA